jgi:hypothetical protein
VNSTNQVVTSTSNTPAVNTSVKPLDEAVRWHRGRPIAPEEVHYTCPKCGMTSSNPHDVAAKYCGHCHEYERERGRGGPHTLREEGWVAVHPAFEEIPEGTTVTLLRPTPPARRSPRLFGGLTASLASNPIHSKQLPLT